MSKSPRYTEGFPCPYTFTCQVKTETLVSGDSAERKARSFKKWNKSLQSKITPNKISATFSHKLRSLNCYLIISEHTSIIHSIRRVTFTCILTVFLFQEDLIKKYASEKFYPGLFSLNALATLMQWR